MGKMAEYHLWFTQVEKTFEKRANAKIESFDFGSDRIIQMYIEGYSVSQAVSHLFTLADEKYGIRRDVTETQ